MSVSTTHVAPQPDIVDTVHKVLAPGRRGYSNPVAPYRATGDCGPVDKYTFPLGEFDSCSQGKRFVFGEPKPVPVNVTSSSPCVRSPPPRIALFGNAIPVMIGPA